MLAASLVSTSITYKVLNKKVLQLDCLSAGLLDFYTKWVIRVFVIPALMLGVVGLQYCFERRRVGHSTAVGYFKANVFLVVFLCYPGVCNQAFGMFNCRKFSGDLSVLVKDYSVPCSTSKHFTFQLFAGIYVFFVAIGIPLYLASLMVRRMREYGGGSGSDRFGASQWESILTAFRLVSTRCSFGIVLS